MIRAWVAFAAIAATMTLVPGVHAQTPADKTTARKLFFEARDAYQANDYAKAAELFERSNGIYPAPTAALGMARALDKAGKLVRAYETYTSIVNAGVADGASPAFTRAVEDARKERETLEPRLPALVITVECACEPSVTIDGQPVPDAALGIKRFVDPGEHQLEVKADGHRTAKSVATAREGEVAEVSFTLAEQPAEPAEPPTAAPPTAPAPAPAPAPAVAPTEAVSSGDGMRVAGLVVGGIGIAGLVAASVTGALYLGEATTVDDLCTDAPDGDGRICSEQEGVDAAGRGNTLALVNTITLPIGAAALATGITLYFVAPSGSSEGIALLPALGPTQAGLTVVGAF